MKYCLSLNIAYEKEELQLMSEKRTNDEQQVWQLEHEWINAFIEGDTETLDRILAEDFIFTDPEGRLLRIT